MILNYSSSPQISNSLWGMFIADALAMPVHWYYDTKALARDYGKVTGFLEPKNPHPDSILWRSHYTPLNESGNILHDQDVFWGKKGIHYHQFLRQGENSLNLKLARQLLILLQEDQAYTPRSWLKRMISYLQDPTSHRDTYVEEYLRHFFTEFAKGRRPEQCGRQDENHIGGFSLMLPMLFTYSDEPDQVADRALSHLALTHGGAKMRFWGTIISNIFIALWNGNTLEQSIDSAFARSTVSYRIDDLSSLFAFPDDVVIRQHFSSACYVEYAVPATLYLALKYQQEPEEALIVNTMCGGDNCGRGALLGAILGSIAGTKWPSRWLDGLLEPPPEISRH
ncbi:MAG: ADP-ribosylglycohydrolase family protein [Desulfobulbaceae bacterium]|nr:MAG: ADP-ribosylglycohydrolase family protein [Desulfobulbaceae bacterium]